MGFFACVRVHVLQGFVTCVIQGLFTLVTCWFTCVTVLFYMCYRGLFTCVTWGLFTRVKRFSLHGFRDVYKGYSKEEFTCLLLYSTAILLAGAVNGGSMLINSHLNKIIYLNVVSGFQRSQLAAQMSFYNFVSELISLI